MIKVSVIILTYNQESTIMRTLKSVYNQNTTHLFEIIIGDDSSTDNTRTICMNFMKMHKKNKITLNDKTQNVGVVRNFCNCLKSCKGEYLMFCAGDDWWHNPNKIQIQVDYMEKNKDCVVYYGGYNIFYPKNGTTEFAYPTNIVDKDLFYQIIKNNPICAPTACVRKKSLIETDYITDVIDNRFSMEDYPMWLTLSHSGKFCYTNVSLVTYTKQIGSLNNSLVYEKKLQYLNEIKRIQLLYIKKFGMYDKYITIIEDTFIKKAAMYAVLYAERKHALFYYKRIRKKTIKTHLKIIVCSIGFIFNNYSLRMRKGIF